MRLAAPLRRVLLCRTSIRLALAKHPPMQAVFSDLGRFRSDAIASRWTAEHFARVVSGAGHGEH